MKIIVIAFAIATMGALASVPRSDDLSITPERGQFCIMPELLESFKEAHAVFVGEVVEIIPPDAKEYHERRLGRSYTIKFRVERAWKGVRARHTFSVESDHGANTELAFPVVHLGEKYLVFADPLYFDGVPQKKWSGISACNRTKLLSNAAEDLKKLDSINARSLDSRKPR